MRQTDGKLALDWGWGCTVFRWVKSGHLVFATS